MFDTTIQPDILVLSLNEEVEYVRTNGMINASVSRNDAPNVHVWYSSDYEIECFETMVERSISIHAKNDRSARYLFKAVKAI